MKAKKRKEKELEVTFFDGNIYLSKKPGLLTSFKSRRHHRMYLIFCR